MNRIRWSAMIASLLAAVTVSHGASATPFTITDHGYRDWPPALLHYPLAGHKNGPVTLLDKDGKPVPAQVADGELLFVASLAKSNTVTFTLGKGKPATSTLKVTTTRTGVEVANEFFAVRLPPLGKRVFKQDTAPGPLTEWQPAGGPWMGASRFVTTRRIASMAAKILQQGPAAVVYEARYQFEPTGEYICRVQVCPGIDYAGITEEYDFGAHTPGQDFLLLELEKHFAPATIGLFRPVQDLGLTAAREPLAPYVAAKAQANVNPPAAVGGTGATPTPPLPEPDLMLLEKIFVAGKWGSLIGGIDLRAAAVDTNTPPAARVAVVPMHVGNWRRTLALTVWQKPGAGVTVALPVSTRQCRWYAETTDDISPFSTHEHDAGLPASYGRREWALAFGAAPDTLQRRAGHIGLDDYKNWVLDWPETTKAGDYPRAWVTKADVAAVKKSLDRHPDKDRLAKFFLISGNPTDALAHAQQVVTGLPRAHDAMSNWQLSGLSHYRQSQNLLQVAFWAEDALACPDLPAELRRALRRAVAASAYLLAHPDVNPRGAGVHLGNNNMSINRSCPLAYVAGLLPDHPLYKSWMDQITAFVAYKLGSQVAWDGADIECPTYWLYGPYRFLEPAVAIIRNTGGPDLTARQAQTVGYFANLTMPDARYNGRRIIPGMGNSANILEGLFGSTLATVQRAQPDRAPLMQTLHRAAWPTGQVIGTPNTAADEWFGFQYRPDVPTGGALTTTIMPTYGVAFRDKFNTPDETAMLFRAGINWSHWDTDDGNVILYGPGAAPLSPGTGYQYYYGPAMKDEAIYHNKVKVGARNQQEAFGRVDDAITDYGFGPSADYAVNSRFRPSQLFPAGNGAMSWNRHVLFLKGAHDYFVMRDTFGNGAGRPTWWTWLNLGTADAIKVDGAAFSKDQTPFDMVVPETAMAAKTGRVLELATPFGASTWMWFANTDPLTFRARLTFTAGNGGLHQLQAKDFPLQSTNEMKTIVEASAKPGEDYYYVVVPRKNGTPAPQCERVGDHALKIKTAESTDYVFVADGPVAFEKEDVVFTGKAGAVRVFADRVALCLNAGSGKVGYKGMIFDGHGPFEKVVKLAELKAGVTAVSGATEKKRQTVDVGEGIMVEGEGPFTAKLDGHKITLTVDGRARVLYVTRPEWMWQPWGTYDGEARMICWTDYPASGWGKYDRTNLLAVSVPDGKHTIELTDRVFPAGWPRRFEPTIGTVAAQ